MRNDTERTLDAAYEHATELSRLRSSVDRYREAMREADEELALIADEASEQIGERIDSVRALLKDVLAGEKKAA